MRIFKATESLTNALNTIANHGISKAMLIESLEHLGCWGLQNVGRADPVLGICWNLTCYLDSKVKDGCSYDTGYALINGVFYSAYPFQACDGKVVSWGENGFRREWCLFLAVLLRTEGYQLAIPESLEAALSDSTQRKQVVDVPGVKLPSFEGYRAFVESFPRNKEDDHSYGWESCSIGKYAEFLGLDLDYLSDFASEVCRGKPALRDRLNMNVFKTYGQIASYMNKNYKRK